jgi:tetratricopeptide (TPR) repeat protein
MGKIICDKCGNEISNDFNNTLLFCTNCGASLKVTASEKTLSLADSERHYPPANQPSKPKKTALYLIGGFALVGALLAAAGGFYFFGQPRLTAKQYRCTIPGEPEPQTSDEYYQRAKKHIEIYSGDGAPSLDDCAFGALNEALRRNPDNAKALRLRGYGYKQRKEYERATLDYDKAVLLEPNNEQNYIARKYFYEELEKFDKAAEDQTAILRLHLKNNPGDAERLIEDYQTRAGFYVKSRDFDNAIKDYTEIIRLKPNSAYGYPFRANAFRDKGDFENAVKDYSEVIRLEPYEANHYYLRASAYRRLGKTDLADADERKFRELFARKR